MHPNKSRQTQDNINKNSTREQLFVKLSPALTQNLPRPDIRSIRCREALIKTAELPSVRGALLLNSIILFE